ncbi:hypothetical protein NPIL_668211 [Nephila pilipes]|uniref:Uncharacterized protein n=1 Tax=Nephila pilipes TaxID=299642 RepID=A0A8X6TB76_NEPPI|nr:hypothetical protein NPIL_668211 [Nephila pilipes]
MLLRGWRRAFCAVAVAAWRFKQFWRLFSIAVAESVRQNTKRTGVRQHKARHEVAAPLCRHARLRTFLLPFLRNVLPFASGDFFGVLADATDEVPAAQRFSAQRTMFCVLGAMRWYGYGPRFRRCSHASARGNA